MIQRIIENKIQEKLFKGKVITLIGARQTGKTSLLKKLITNQAEPAIWLNADEFDIKERFKKPNIYLLKIPYRKQ